MATSELVNLQDQGFEPTLKEAGAKLAAAKRATPRNMWGFFTSGISFRDGGYEWFWVLR